MKKRFAMLLLCGMMLFTVTGCGAVFSISGKELKSYAKKNGYEVLNTVEDGDGEASYLKESMTINTGDFVLEYYQTDTSSHASSWVDAIKRKISDGTVTVVSSSSPLGEDYTVTRLDNHFRILRYRNTILFFQGDETAIGQFVDDFQIQTGLDAGLTVTNELIDEAKTSLFGDSEADTTRTTRAMETTEVQ